MGSCVSAHKNMSKESAAKKDKLSDIPSMKDNKLIVADVALNSQLSSSRSWVSGSRDETFFESKPWLESDCDDDFYSVNGELTPSRGSTPIHPSFSKGHSRDDTSLSDGNASSLVLDPSPMEKKKMLVELFRESIRENQNGHNNDQNASELPDEKETIINLPLKSTNGTPSDTSTNSVCISERAANRDFLNEREEPIRSVHCCLPRFTSSQSLGKRNKMDPSVATNNAPAEV